MLLFSILRFTDEERQRNLMLAVTATHTMKLMIVLLCWATWTQAVLSQQAAWDALPDPNTNATAQPSPDEATSLEDNAQGNLPKPSQTSYGVSAKSLVELQTLTQSIIAKSAPAVVAIGETGSGVIVNAQGLILTASHVTRYANRRVSVAFSDGRVLPGITLGSNIASDTGAIRLLSPGPFPFVSVQDSKEAKPGTWCIAMGYPLSFPRRRPATGRLGRILSRGENGKLVSDCTIMGGDSGGPLLNLKGNVIAISSSVKLAANENLSIPSEQFIKDWKDIARLIDKTAMDAQVQPAQSSTDGKRKVAPQSSGNAYLGINAETDQNRVRIRAVHRNSPAEFAGLRANDVILELDSQAISSFAQLVGHLKTRKPGDALVVLVNRYGALIRTEVTLGGTDTKK